MKRYLVIFFGVLWAGTALPSDALPDRVTINGVEFVRIPAGEFIYTVETPAKWNQPSKEPMYRHVQVWLDEFYIARYEALARDLERFFNSGAADPEMLARLWANEGLVRREAHTAYNEKTHPFHKDNEDPGCTVRRAADGRFYRPATDRDDLPAMGLSWEAADVFARWMGFRLPTEAEWQKAARGTDRRVWPWGDEIPDDTRAYFRSTRFCAPLPVGLYPTGRSPYGVEDMAGSTAEFVADWLNDGFDAALRDGDRNPPLAVEGRSYPHDRPQNKKIVKGGRYDERPQYLAIATRRLTPPEWTSGRESARFALDSTVVRRYLEGQAAGGTPTMEAAR